MIKLPKSIVDELVNELTSLLDKKENSLTEDEVADILRNNETYSRKERELLLRIETLNKELVDVRARIKPVPLEEVVDDKRIQEITEMLVLSGYYVKVIKVDGEYLEETGLYKEEVVTKEQVLAEEQEIIISVESIEEVDETASATTEEEITTTPEE